MTTTTNEKDQAIFDQLPAVPEGATFELQKVKTIVQPHPYCITPKHLEYNDSVYLNADTIARAESKGAHCGVRGCQLSYAKHEPILTAFIRVPVKLRKLDDVPGLHQWLLDNKAACEALGIQGFAFPFASAD